MDGNDSIKNYCRICASNPPDVHNIFEAIYEETPLSDILGQCLQCTVHRTECFPEYVCLQCCADLLTMHKFIANYEKSKKWFTSRYEALNDARIIKTETVCLTEFEKTSDISVEPNHQIFVESVINAVSIQDQTPNPLEVKEEFDYDYKYEIDDLQTSPNESALEFQEPNERNYNNDQENLAAPFCDAINELIVAKATQNKEKIRHGNKTGKSFECYFCDEIFRRSDYRVNHIRKVHPEVHLECFVCKMTNDTFYDLQQHIQEDCHGSLSQNESNHPKKISQKKNCHERKPEQYKCKSCSERFLNLISLKKHENNHTKPGHSCEVCGKSFSMRSLLIDHQLKHTDERTFKCTHQDCQKAYKHKRNLQEHLKIHEGKKVIHFGDQQKIVASHQCPLCPKVFTNKKLLNAHKGTHSGKQYKCKYCGLLLASRAGKGQHQRNIHEKPRSYECFDCKQVFRYHLDLLRHMDIHSSNGRITFECEICSKPFWTERQFIIHRRKHNEQVFNCEYCNETFEKRFELQFHVREMHVEKMEQYRCNRCSKRFPLESALKSHTYYSHTVKKREKNHLCAACGRRFECFSSLKIHLKAHSDERPLSCSCCPKKFKYDTQLKYHMLVHSIERKFICHALVDGEHICGKTFKFATALRAHKKIHYPSDKPFACLSCPAKFYTKSRLEFHTRIHTDERLHKCDHCDRLFKHKTDLTQHILIHLGPTPHKCSECNASFRLVTELRKHSFEHYKPPTAE